jgi:predicted kinase
MEPVLLIFSGLPGVGKTTIAKLMAEALRAVYLRADTIEQALRHGGVDEVGGLGYGVGYALATENLRLGRSVVADSVNPWPLTREAWRDAARRAGHHFFDVEVVCSDLAEHRRRVESRVSDVPGLVGPDWDAVIGRDYKEFVPAVDGRYLRVDTAPSDLGFTLETLCAELWIHSGIER